ncbi:hypothetical protein [Lujinxingia litoralis]|nr:hypothetical protein [Lujinxingia litoralis]
MRTGAWGWWVGLIVLAGTCPAEAQEILYDPENPAFQEVREPAPETPVQDEQACGEPECEAEGAEVLVDPENPGAEVLVDPENARPAHLVAYPPTSGAFQTTELTIHLGTGVWRDLAADAPDEDLWELSTELGLRISYEPSSRLRAVLAARASHWAARPVGGPFRAYDDVALDEAYIVWRPGRLRLSIGNQRTPWGSTDITRPGDVINPSGLRSPGSGGAFGASLPQLTAEAAYTFDAFALSAVVVPFFKPDNLALFGRDTALATRRNPFIAEELPFILLAQDLLDPSIWPQAQPLLQSANRPMATPANASVGLRVTTTLANTDLGLGGYYGWDRTPYMEMDEDLRTLLNLIAEDGQLFADFDAIGFAARNPEAIPLSQRLSARAEAGETLFRSEFRRRLTAVADLARYVGPIGVRADVAFSPRRVFYTTTMAPVIRASVFSALGLSYERLLAGERVLALTLEGFWLHPFAADGALSRALVPREQAGDADDELLIFEGGYYGVAGALNWGTGLWKIDVQAGAMLSIAPGDVIGQLALERPFARGMRARLSANLFYGPDPAERLTLGGLWSANDQVALSVVGSF